MRNKRTGDILTDILEKLDASVKACFLSGIICGLLAHIYALTNHLYNYDEIWWTPAGIGTGAQHGRWGLDIVSRFMKTFFGDTYTLPVINGFLTIIMYAAAACVVIKIFDITDKIYAICLGALFTTFPAVVSRMFFMFTTYPYAIGVFSAALSAYLIIHFHKKWYHIAIPVVLLAFAMSVYQANFVTAVCSVVGFLILDFLRICRIDAASGENTAISGSSDTDMKMSIIRCINYVIYLALGIILYFAANKLVLKTSGKELSPLEGFDTMGQIGVSDLFSALKGCYTRFIRFGYGDVYSVNPTIFTKIAFIVSFLVFAYTIFIILKSSAKTHIKVLLILLFLVLPVAINLIIIMASSSGVMYTIMLYEPVFIFAIASGIAESLSISDSKNGTLLHIVYGCCLIVCVPVYIWFANGNYLALQYTNVHDTMYYTAVVTQIKSLEGYHDDMPVIYIGYPKNDSTNNRGSMVGETFGIGGKMDSNITGYSSYNIMSTILGFNPERRDSDEDENYFFNHPDVKSMPCYPDSGSIAIIDDTVVVKFDEAK